MPRTAAALIIGNELLSGKIRDSNLHDLARLLRRLGVLLRRVVMVLDEIDTIADEVRALSSSHDLLFTSGGVGPTHDDVTMAAVAKAFGQQLIPHPGLIEVIQSHHGGQAKDGHLAMALVPESTQLRSRPGASWPATTVGNVWVLPGLPEAFTMKLAIVEAHLQAEQPYLSRAVYSDLDEGNLKPLLDAVVAAFPDVDVGSYPTWTGDYSTKLTFDGKDATRIEMALRAFIASLPQGEPKRVE